MEISYLELNTEKNANGFLLQEAGVVELTHTKTLVYVKQHTEKFTKCFTYYVAVMEMSAVIKF